FRTRQEIGNLNRSWRFRCCGPIVRMARGGKATPMREVSGSETARVDLAAYRRHGFRPDVERQLTDGRRPMQFILIVVTIAAAILFDVRPSGAYQGPWCAVENIGDDVRYDCSMRSLEQCVPLIIAGNRGFCLPNPYYRGPEAAPPRVKRKR